MIAGLALAECALLAITAGKALPSVLFGIALGVLVGWGDRARLRADPERFKAARTASDVRRELNAGTTGRFALVFWWSFAAMAALMAVRLNMLCGVGLGHAFARYFAAVFACMLTRDVITYPSLKPLDR